MSSTRMLINATQQEELRVALVEGQMLIDLDIEARGRELKISNVYKGIVTHVEPSLNAAFVNYGAERHGFLPLKEVAAEYLQSPEEGSAPSLREGQEIIVQIEKEERGNKGAALTTFISLAGCYIVLKPNNPRAGGISRRIEGEERQEMRDTLENLQIPEGMGIILRTAGLGRSLEELQWDLQVLQSLWTRLKSAADERAAPFLILQEGNVVLRSIRDYLKPNVNEILVDDPSTFEMAKEHIRLIRPDFISRIKLYQDSTPLFTRYQIEGQIRTAHHRDVELPSGGSIVIDRTEALTCIDVNSARATRGGDLEETALNTNLEAAREVARQLRLRDLGGLIVIDFIDMHDFKHQRDVESALKEALKADRARVQVGRISRFGLMEMSRQRLRPSLSEGSQITCPRCSGHGTISGVESFALSMLRSIEEEAMKEGTRQVQAQLPVDIATFLLNEKRQAILGIESRHQIHVLIIPNPHFLTPQFKIDRLKEEASSSGFPSYQLAEKPDDNTDNAANKTRPFSKTDSAPAISNIAATNTPKSPSGSFLKRLWSSLFATETDYTAAKVKISENTTNSTESQSTAQPYERQQRRSYEGQQRRGGYQQRRGNNGHRQGSNQRGRSEQRRQPERREEPVHALATEQDEVKSFVTPSIPESYEPSIEAASNVALTNTENKIENETSVITAPQTIEEQQQPHQHRRRRGGHHRRRGHYRSQRERHQNNTSADNGENNARNEAPAEHHVPVMEDSREET